MVSKQNTEQHPAQPSQTNSRIISKVLSPAIRLWLRSQVEAAETLQFQIEGGDRQILSGYIPRVTVTAENVIYQGIALSHIRAVGEEIRINLKQVLQGVPLRLMDAVPIWAEAVLHQSDINRSLQTPLFANAVNELLISWLQPSVIADLPDFLKARIQNPSIQLGTTYIQLDAQRVLFKAELLSAKEPPVSLLIRTGLQLDTDSQISLQQPEWALDEVASTWRSLTHLQDTAISLGSDVSLQQLSLEAGQIVCQGQIRVLP